MQMQAYIEEIRHALDQLLQAVWAEHRAVEELTANLEIKARATEEGYRQAARWMRDEDADDVMAGAGVYWETRFGADKERYALNGQRSEAAERLAVRSFSRAAMAGSVLQCAKQGISIVNGELAASPDGRAIGNQALKDIIWHGRNQSLHWEDGGFSKAVEACFDRLTAEVDSRFAEYLQRNMAFEVVEALGWTDTDAAIRDLATLG